MGSDKFGVFFFGGKGSDSDKSKKAQNYGNWLLNLPYKIHNISVCLDKKEYTEKVGDNANQFLLRGINGRVNESELDGSVNLGCNYRLHGVLNEASLQKYTKIDLNLALKDYKKLKESLKPAQIIGIERLLSKLEQ